MSVGVSVIEALANPTGKLMYDVTADDWDALRTLAEQVGCPADRVGALRKRLTATETRKGSPYVLLVGRPEGRLDLFLARCFTPEAAEAVSKAAGRPVSIGPAPGDVQPKVGSWAEHRLKLPIPGHLVALRAAGKPPADVVAQLATLGHFDACVLVVSLHQVLSEGERALLHAASSLGIVARILVVAVPGEEPTADDLAQLTALGRRCLLNAGFQGDRAGDVGLWFTDGAPRKNTVSNVASFLSVDPAAVAAGRAAWANQSLVALVTELAEHAKKTASPSVPLVEEKDQDRLTTELDSFLTDLGKRLERDLAKRPMAADRVRREVIEAIRGWSAYLGMEGSWMKLVDRLRPGAQKALQTEVEAGVAELEFEPGRAPTIATPAAPPDRTTMLATRIIVALAAGVGMYAVTAWALSEVAGQMATTAPVTDGAPAAALAAPLPEPVRMAVSVAALLAGSVLGFAFSGRFFAQTAPQAVAPATTAQLHGWPQFQRRLTTWFRQYIGSRPALPAEECVAWLARLGASPESRS